MSHHCFGAFVKTNIKISYDLNSQLLNYKSMIRGLLQIWIAPDDEVGLEEKRLHISEFHVSWL